MIQELKPYPEYKDSGAPWLGEIPAHWRCLPHRAVFREVKDQGHKDEPLLSVTISRGVIQQSELLAESSKKDSSNLDKAKYKLVVPGDIAYNKMRAWQGAIGSSHHRGIVSPAYIVVRPRISHNPDYFHFLFRTPAFATEAERWSYGITSDQWNLRSEHFKMIYSCVPPRPEQDAVVAFLRQFESKVRRFIRNRRRLIELLNEQKQAIINQAVTRGLDPYVPLKPSGIDWLGGIPEHWEVKRLKNLGQGIIGLTFAPQDLTDEEGTLVLRASNIRNGKLVFGKDVFVRTRIPGKLWVTSGDILICSRSGSRGLIGKSALIPEGLSASFGVFMSVFRSEINDFIYCILNSRIFNYLAAGFATSTINQLTLRELHELIVPLPPRHEQLRIVQFITHHGIETDQAIERARREIELIREYRSRLIADVVTGKVDVRHLAREIAEPDTEDLESLRIDGVIDDEMSGEDEAEIVEEKVND